jgi:hypothetical protein
MASDPIIQLTNQGRRYALGYGADFYGIWDQQQPEAPIERFPRTDDGWKEAWTRYSALDWPMSAPPKKRRRPWLVALLIVVGVLVSLAVIGAGIDAALPHELLKTDFRQSADPFEVGQDGSIGYDLSDGSYRVTMNSAGERAISYGELVRTAYAIGVRADVAEVTSPKTRVGVLCGWKTYEGPAGYAFEVAPGGSFNLWQIVAGGSQVLDSGTDASITTVERVSITCVPVSAGGSDIEVVGYANGSEVARGVDPHGNGKYTWAGLTVVADEEGTEVRFVDASARLPDEQWVP